MLKAALAACAAALAAAAHGQVQPPGYPGDYASIVAAARKEGRLVIYSTTDSIAAQPLTRDFRLVYPDVEVDYVEMNSTELHSRFLAEARTGAPSADLLWSSAMDLQFKLVNDGHALVYRSPEAAAIPSWAVWRYEAYGTTLEPIVIAYNKRLLDGRTLVPSHAALAALLAAEPARFRGKVATYDPERSGLGFLLVSNDAKTSRTFWDLARAFGKVEVRLYGNTETMMERVSSGEHLIGYNLLGSYASSRARKDPSIGFLYPKDYTLVISRVAFIARSSRHPNAARLWLDYLLSRRGQALLATRVSLYALRQDVEGEATAAALGRELGATLKPISIGPALIAHLDQAKREEFLRQWRLHIGARK